MAMRLPCACAASTAATSCSALNDAERFSVLSLQGSAQTLTRSVPRLAWRWISGSIAGIELPL